MERGIKIDSWMMPVIAAAFGNTWPKGVSPEQGSGEGEKLPQMPENDKAMAALAASGILRDDEDGVLAVDDTAYMAILSVWKANDVLLCRQKTGATELRVGFYIYSDSITMMTWEENAYRLLYMPSVKLAMGALADMFWSADSSVKTQTHEQRPGAPTLEALSKALGDAAPFPGLFPGKQDREDTYDGCWAIRGIESLNVQIQWIIQIKNGTAQLWEYDPQHIYWGAHSRTDLINRIGRWLIDAHRRSILKLNEKAVDKL